MTYDGFVPDLVSSSIYDDMDKITWQYTCSSRLYVDKAVAYHKKIYCGKQYQPVQVKLVQFCDWVDGKKGVWIVKITNNNPI